ncbi:hypothetical protein [Vibrio sp. D431a]|uniref:hypothetical protein n=1 Tax=Vibrio sp. D431a TaxID=2837388 RepID=UPI0025562753|nr:hypothetical protein [Vibrio sp. D431a]MDK9790738.1 hypothetical protein [Vibrio sp. D431a]
MHFIGYLIYAAVVAAFFYVDKVHEQITMAYELATEIVIGCLVMGVLPLLVFFIFHVSRKRELQYKQTFATISGACASIVVSLGLIGTFVGLTDMITQIAGAVGAKGGSVEEQISGIMVAIGSSLDAMAFAFLTSVMGVAGSVIVLASGVCFREYFDPDDSSNGDDIELDFQAMQKLIQDNNQIKLYINKLIGTSLDKNEVASIIINNSKQVGELTKSTKRLSDIYSVEIEREEALNDRMDSQDKVIQSMIKQQQAQEKVLSKLIKATEANTKATEKLIKYHK